MAMGETPQISAEAVARHVVFAVLMGAIGAGLAFVLLRAVELVGWTLDRWPLLLLGLPVFGAASMLLYRAVRIDPHIATDTVIADMRDARSIPAALVPAVLVGVALTLVGGGSVGAGAAALQMGAAAGSALGRTLKLRPLFPRAGEPSLGGYTAACGMAAAFSCMHLTPVGAVVLMLELTRFSPAVVRYAPLMVLSVGTAYAIAAPLKFSLLFPAATLPPLAWDAVAQCLVVGLACGAVGALFAFALRETRKAARRMPSPALAAAAGGVLFVVLVLAFGLHGYLGTSLDVIGHAVAGPVDPLGFAAKAVLTVIALGFGFKGGEFLPLFVTGALLGNAMGLLVGADAGMSAALGFGALFAAATRCPLAGFCMACEGLGFGGAPLYALAIAVAYVGSVDFGLFGRGVASHVAHLRREARQVLRTARTESGGEGRS